MNLKEAKTKIEKVLDRSQSVIDKSAFSGVNVRQPVTMVDGYGLTKDKRIDFKFIYSKLV